MPSFERCVVLVADDELTVLRIVTFALTRHGYEVITAPDGPSALRLCQEREGPIHLALLDVLMPGMSGPELYESLPGLHPKIEVMFMSGYQQEKVLPPTVRYAHFIAKPFLPRDLVQRVNTILGNEDICITLDDKESTHA